MQIHRIYDPILRRTMPKVTVFDAELKKEADEMVKAMKANVGMGLAANQVGIEKQLIVLAYEPGKEDDQPSIPVMQLCNPIIVKATPEQKSMTEGCLSIPGLELPVKRSIGVTVAAQNITGKPVKIKAKGLLARILQHEIDHINGTLFTDRVKDFSEASAKDLKEFRFAKIVFFGSDDFSAEIFQALRESGLNLIAAITETDKTAGRGNQLTSPVIKNLAVDAGVAVFQPEDKKEITDIVRQLEPDLIVLASYGKILPSETLALPKLGSLNVHPSLLPKYRGATPIQSVILAGETETGVTIMTMTPEVDAGGLVTQQTLPIDSSDTTPSLRAKLAELGAELLIKSLPVYLSGQAKIQSQDPSAITQTTKLSKEMGEIDWSKPAQQLDREIRAFQPWPGSYTFVGEKRLKILDSEIKDQKLALKMVQLEGKKPTNWPDFVRGYHQELTKCSWFDKIA